MAVAKVDITDKTYSDSKADNLAQTTGDVLREQQKVKIRLSLDPVKKLELQKQEEAGKKVEWPAHPVYVNGYTYVLKLGESVEVPQTVADILEHAGMI